MDPAPNRLLLVTAASPVVPSYYIEIDARLISVTRPGPPVVRVLNAPELALAGDDGALVLTFIWGIALAAVSAAGHLRRAALEPVGGLPGRGAAGDSRVVEPLPEPGGAAAEPVLADDADAGAQAGPRHGERNRPMTDVPAQSTGDDTLYEPPGYPPAGQADAAASDGNGAGEGLSIMTPRAADTAVLEYGRPGDPLFAPKRLVGLEARNISAWFGEPQGARAGLAHHGTGHRHRAHRAVRLRQVHVPAHPQPHARDGDRAPAWAARCCSAATTSTTPAPAPPTCGGRSAWCSRSPTRSRPCPSTTTWPAA